METTEQKLPLIDISPLIQQSGDTAKKQEVAAQIDAACRSFGFFRITGHGVPVALQEELDSLSRQFFNLPHEEKAKISIKFGGAAWRGWFPVGDELTSGKPDQKEGIYIGQELPDDHPRVASKVPLHGRNQFPENPADLGKVVINYFHHMSEIGKALLRGLALGLGMSEDWFAETICKEPMEFFNLFHYPPQDLSDLKEGEHPGWGVREHTDYGLLSILAQDDCGGLQVKLPGNNWIKVEPEPGVFVCNIGDMLDKLTEGRYRSTPHRVLNVSGRQRLSFPFFVDPSWDAVVTALPLAGSPPADDSERRWDGKSVHAWSGTYGDYMVNKGKKAFPEIF